MGRRADDDDDDDDDEPPRRRYGRIVVGSIFAVLGAAGAVGYGLRMGKELPAPVGDMEIVTKSLHEPIHWGALIVCALIAMIGAAVALTELWETRGRRS